jgi:hypothetical protein
MYLLSFETNLGLIPVKLPFTPKLAYVFETGSVCYGRPAIPQTLDYCDRPKIIISVVEGVVILMIRDAWVPEFKAQNYSGHAHQNAFLFSR